MTERDLFIQSIPQIAEMIIRCRGLTTEEFEEFKMEVLEETNEDARSFMKNILRVIEENL